VRLNKLPILAQNLNMSDYQYEAGADASYYQHFPKSKTTKLAPVESLLDSDVELFTEDHKTRLPGARTPAADFYHEK
jgi:hypothetical protein